MGPEAGGRIGGGGGGGGGAPLKSWIYRFGSVTFFAAFSYASLPVITGGIARSSTALLKECIEKGLQRKDWRLVEESARALQTLSEQSDTQSSVLQLRPLGVLADAIQNIDAANVAESQYEMSEYARRGAKQAMHSLAETLSK